MANDIKYEVNAGFFDAIDRDRLYSADDMNRPYRKLISNGVFATPKGTPSDNLQVFTADDEMNIIVFKGDAIIGDKWFENPSNLIITVSQNSKTLTRIDSIIAQMDKTQAGRIGNIVYRQGAASSNPVHPDINTEENIIEFRLADIRISPSCVKITQDLITDCRGSDECPWITSLIYQVDTSTLHAQWQKAYEKYFEEQKEANNDYTEEFKTMMTNFFDEEEQAFINWFENIKELLSEDAAGNLQNQIDKLNSNAKIAISNEMPINGEDVWFKPEDEIIYVKDRDTYIPFSDLGELKTNLIELQRKSKYSTDEIKVGTWIDGKPVYRKVIEFGALPDNSFKSVEHGISNLDLIVKKDVIATGTGHGQFIGVPDVSNNIQYNTTIVITKEFVGITAYTNRTGYSETYVILEYTKTTD